jgi:1-acyl-sn-glycerol-3-phosphate acyltransferase
VYGAPVYWDKQPWPRTQADVRRVTASLRNSFRDHLVEATALTGRTLPGPIPAIREEDVRITKEQR